MKTSENREKLESEKKTEELLRMQINSKAYSDWLSSENDIYDEVFNKECFSGGYYVRDRK